jgi:hypothetical protein
MNRNLGINLWNSFDRMSIHEKKLRNTTQQWSGMDKQETLKALQQQNINTYTEDDFFYKFNSLGFRSNEFDNTEDIKILYAGCSVTEGTGLPVNHIWGSFLNDQISKETNKSIKFFSVARGGISIDTIVRYTYIAIEHTGFKPDFVYLMLPSVLRRELIFTEYGSVYTDSFIPGWPPLDPGKSSKTAAAYVHLDALINYRQSYNDCFRNLLFMKHYLMSKNIKWAFSFWDDEFNPERVTSAIGIEKDSDPSIPIELEDHYIKGGFTFDRHGIVYNTKNFEFIFPQSIARDGAHWGPNSHYNFSKNAYQYLIKKDYFQELLTKWKN